MFTSVPGPSTTTQSGSLEKESLARRISLIDAFNVDKARAKESWITSTLLPSVLSYSIYHYIKTATPLFSVVIYPLLQVSIPTVAAFAADRMQSALNALFSIGSGSRGGSTETGCAGLLRQLVQDQERTMFYTVTVNPLPATTKASNKVDPNLKWQCACALSRSQSVIKRTNSNSSQYYTITYLSDLESSPSPSLVLDILQDKEKEKQHSPVKMYINS